MRVSRTTFTCTLLVKGYGAYWLVTLEPTARHGPVDVARGCRSSDEGYRRRYDAKLSGNVYAPTANVGFVDDLFDLRSCEHRLAPKKYIALDMSISL